MGGGIDTNLFGHKFLFKLISILIRNINILYFVSYLDFKKTKVCINPREDNNNQGS